MLLLVHRVHRISGFRRVAMLYPRFRSRPFVGFLCAVIVIIASLSPAKAQEPPSILFGVYYGNQGWKMDQVQVMERWIGKPHATLLLFTNFCDRAMKNLFGQQLSNIWKNGNVPIITWEPFLCSTTPNDIEVRIASGQYDTYVRTWASELKRWLSGPDGTYGNADDRRAYLRLAHEMNGNWYPWSAVVGNNTPDQYVAMWKRVYNIFSGPQGVGIESTRLQWIWAVNHEDVGSYKAEQYYPSDSFVGWVAIDGYNWGASQSWSSWKSPADAYNNMVDRLRAISNKPLAITEVGSTSLMATGRNINAKSQWISDLYSYVKDNDIRMVVWFNEDKETDWAVFGGTYGDSQFVYGRTRYQVYASYRDAVTKAPFIGTTTTNPRLLRDNEFAGN